MVPAAHAQQDVENTVASTVPPAAVAADSWYLDVAIGTDILFWDADLKSAITQAENSFNGSEINVNHSDFKTSMYLVSAKKVKRAATPFMPGIHFRFGKAFGKHAIDLGLGVSGLLPTSSIEMQSSMLLEEYRICNPSNLTPCPLARLGYVEDSTAQKDYILTLTMNEVYTLIAPTVGYSYKTMQLLDGDLFARASVSFLAMSSKQRIDYLAYPQSTTTTTHALQGVLESTQTSDIGFKVAFSGLWNYYTLSDYQLWLELGITYGIVNMNRTVNGYGSIIYNDSIAASYSHSDNEIAWQSSDTFYLTGFFINAGVRL